MARRSFVLARSSCFSLALAGALVCFAGALACKSSEKAPAAEVAPLRAEPVRFQFALPSEYVQLELRGEGSETLRVPADARLEPVGGGFSIEAGSEFALELRLPAPPATELPGTIAGAQRVVQEPDLVVFESGGAYWFVVSRELVPEWDETDRRRVACASAGALAAGASAGKPRLFSRPAIEHMVATCRSLDLPRLE
jgi:hypothetical protein